ncbi:MAG: hypothetical protein RLZ98_100 [Pseudomonadota bacterium]|jgi:taurine dioxygenase
MHPRLGTWSHTKKLGETEDGMVAFENLTEHTGAEILGIDLRHPLSKEDAAEIYSVFLNRTVIVFRGQDLTQDELVRTTASFGELGEYDRPAEFHNAGQRRTHPRVMLITNIREDGQPIGALPDGEMWFHHDKIHRPNPDKATLLYSVQIPTWGGETMFSNLMAAYQALPADLKKAVDGRMAAHSFNYGSQKKDDPNALAAQSQSVHPAVITSDENGQKALYVDRLMTTRLLDMPEDESDEILNRLFDHIEKPEFVYEHVWKKGDLVMWDNRTSIHARKDFPADQTRLMWRTTIAGSGKPA